MTRFNKSIFALLAKAIAQTVEKEAMLTEVVFDSLAEGRVQCRALIIQELAQYVPNFVVLGWVDDQFDKRGQFEVAEFDIESVFIFHDKEEL